MEIPKHYLDKFEIKENKKRRDDLFFRLLTGWNHERQEANIPLITAKRLAMAINKNPFLKKSDDELEHLIKICEQRGNYKFAHYILFK